ncbi:hypothetical protein [Dankookia rubra]|uniref:hypothetical protein n=1 Tax=Dankookia rubra TaxID=1442381 RepID=UPI00140DEC75|nr:hypothetical protein [Dankookia rubra]
MFGDDAAYAFSTITIAQATGASRLDGINDHGDIVGNSDMMLAPAAFLVTPARHGHRD